MQALHFTYGLGSFVAPLICEPFLSKKAVIGHHIKLSDLEGIDNNSSHDSNSVLNITDFTTDEQIRSNPIMIYIPYAFVGILSIAGAASVLMLYIHKKYEPPLKNDFLKITEENRDLIKSTEQNALNNE